MKKLALLVFLLCILPISSLAGTCDTISCTGKILNLYPHGGNGKVYIEIDGNKGSLNCTLVQEKFVVLKPDSKLHSEIYSMLLAVTVAQKDVRVRILENSPECELLYTMLKN